jgi:hypothetical protein
MTARAAVSRMAAIAVVFMLACPAGAARAQDARPWAEAQAGGPGDVPQAAPLTVPEVERMWDSYLAAQAKTALGLNEAQFLRFSARLQDLQNLRRQHQRQRRQLMSELSEMVRAQGAISNRDAVIAKLRELDEWNIESARQAVRGYAAIDGILNIRQRVRFRSFEERMAQQKLELLAEARRAARGRGQGPGRLPAVR